MNIEKLITEEIDSQINKLDLKSRDSVKKVITELFAFSSTSLLKNLGSQESILGDKESLGEENWDWLIQIINQSFSEEPEEWKKSLKDQKLTILCFKFFTRQDLIELKEVEKELKFEIKKYFSALQNYSDLDNFREKFFNLPSELLKNFSRYILNHSKKLNSSIHIDKKEVQERIKELAEDRKTMIKKIALVSKSYQSVLDLSKIKDLYDNGLFFEDNFLNRGVNEYIVKLLNHKVAVEKIKNVFNSVFVYNMQGQAESCAAYLKHIESIKTEQAQEYFTADGFQIGTRFDNEIELAENASAQKGLVIDKESRFKEPNAKLQQVAYPWQDASNATTGGSATDTPAGGGGGGGFGGGGGTPSSVSQFEGGEEQGLDGSLADTVGGGEEGETDAEGNPITNTAGAEGEMPTDKDGFPIDFGTPEDNNATPPSEEEQPKK